MQLEPQPSTALALLRRRRFRQQRCGLSLIRRSGTCTSKYPADLELGLGITELAGSAGCGKSQIALGLCVTCACTRLEPGGTFESSYAKSLYVCLGDGMPQATTAKRLHQMAEVQKVESNLEQRPTNAILSNILTRWIRNQDDFEHFLFRELPNLLRNEKDIAFVAMDSIASIFRICEGKLSLDAAFRSGKLFRIAAQLKNLSESHRLPVLIVNQVTADFSAGRGDCVLPALGLSWASCVNESYVVSRQEANRCCSKQDESQPRGTQSCPNQFRRTIQCVVSPSRSVSETRFVIDGGGAKRVLNN